MLQEAVLDLARADAVAARRDDVVVAADEAQVTLVVQAALVAGHQPVAAELGGRGLRIAPVFEKHHRIGPADGDGAGSACRRSEEHTSELQSLMRISYAVFCLKKKISHNTTN